MILYFYQPLLFTDNLIWTFLVRITSENKIFPWQTFLKLPQKTIAYEICAFDQIAVKVHKSVSILLWFQCATELIDKIITISLLTKYDNYSRFKEKLREI